MENSGQLQARSDLKIRHVEQRFKESRNSLGKNHEIHKCHYILKAVKNKFNCLDIRPRHQNWHMCGIINRAERNTQLNWRGCISRSSRKGSNITTLRRQLTVFWTKFSTELWGDGSLEASWLRIGKNRVPGADSSCNVYCRSPLIVHRINRRVSRI